MGDRASDALLITQILARDRRALSVFYRRFVPQLSSYIHSKIGDREDAEEVLQDTLFAFLEAIRDFHGKSSIKTFLFSIAHHKVVDHYRKRKLKQLVFSRAPNLEFLVSPLLSPEEELDVTILKEKIQKALSGILPQYRLLLVSKYMDNLSVADISRKFALSFKSAESQLFRARKAFVELFLSI
jgi:RNA polymerase sigma-70 factor (ECF subfamily)